MDLVPRLLESTKVTNLLPIVQHMMLKTTSIVATKASSTGSFVPIGTSFLLLNDSIKAFNSLMEKDKLSHTVEELYHKVTGSTTHKAADGLILRMVSDHSVSKYVGKLQAAVVNTVPVLFNGGGTDAYEAVNVKRMSGATGWAIIALARVSVRAL